LIAWHARFAQVKNLHLLFQVARALPQHTFLVSGGGPLFSKFSLEAPENVVILGWRSAADVFCACDVVLSTSHNEGVPFSLIEASMLGKPVIATNIGSVGEIVIDGKSGFLVEPNVESFRTKIVYLGQHREELSLMSVQARELSLSMFNVKRFSKLFEDMIKDIFVNRRVNSSDTSFI